MNTHNIITGIEPDSIAHELGICPGDILLEINGKAINDVFDYRYLINDEEILLLIRTGNGAEEIEYEIEKDADEDLGLIFGTGLMDDARSCRNKCIFCFIDQLPGGMRETLYFKDDDMRLSFLRGNYVTMTNMSGSELDRIIFYHLSPINISVHTTNPDLRVKMLNNKNAGNIMANINKLAATNIEMNFQVVLCRDINDGAALDKTIKDLSAFMPLAKSLSVVPVGITEHRRENNLCTLTGFDKASSAALLNQINNWQKKLLDSHGSRFVYAADEFYIKADAPFPDYSEYEGFPQLENGVGMIALMGSEFSDCLNNISPFATNRTVSVATGVAAYNFILGLTKRLSKTAKGITINVIAVENDFFGKEITVSGLLTGGDIIRQLSAKKALLGERLFIPANALRENEPIFLDNTTLSDVEWALAVPVTPVESTGVDFIQKLLYFN